MPVYVDEAVWPFRRMMMCHLIADSHKELIEMVDRIGVQRKWIQQKGTRQEHFDICKSKRGFAIQCGAIPITGRELAFKCMEKGRTREGYYQTMPRRAIFVVAGSREEYRISRAYAGLYTASYVLSSKQGKGTHSFEQVYDEAYLIHSDHRGADRWCHQCLDFNNWGWEEQILKIPHQDHDVEKQFEKLIAAAQKLKGDIVCVAFPLPSSKNTPIFIKTAKAKGLPLLVVPEKAGEIFKDKLPKHYV